MELTEVDNVSFHAYEKENTFIPGNEKKPTLIVITPYTYSDPYITKALQAITDNPGQFIILAIPIEYSDFGFAKSYEDNEKHRLNLIKTALAYECDHMYESIYAVKCFYKKVSS